MWIDYMADDSHEMSRLIFFKNEKKKKKQYMTISSAAVVTGILRLHFFPYMS